MSEQSGPFQALLGALSPEDLSAVRERVARDLKPFTEADGSLELPAAVNVAVATRPGT